MISPYAPWYRSGTVTTTQGSTSITGVNTAWAFGSEIRQGDLFTVDGSKFYEIAASPSATSLTLVTPFLESSAADSTYAIIRNFAVIPGTELVTSTLDTIKIWKDFQAVMFDWQTKPYDAITPATVDFVGLDGEITTIKSLPQVVGETNIQSYLGHIELNLFGPAAANQEIAFNQEAYWQVTVDKNTTLTAVDPAQTARVILMLVRTGVGPYQITFPAKFRDRNGAALAGFELNTTSQMFEFLWNGSNYYRIN